MRLTSSIGQCIGLAALLTAVACGPGVSRDKPDATGVGPINPIGPEPEGDGTVLPPATGGDAAEAGSGGIPAGPLPSNNGTAGAAGTGATTPPAEADAAGPSTSADAGVGGDDGGSGEAASPIAGSGAAGKLAVDASEPVADAGSAGKPVAATPTPTLPPPTTPMPKIPAPAPAAAAPIDLGPPVDGGPLVERIGFGSCNDLTRPQDFWASIVAQKPQAFLFLGDNAYLDYGDTYDKLGAIPGFKSLLAIARPLAIWDDHDFGMNDGGGSFSGKDLFKKKFIDFWGPLGAVPATSPRRTRAGNYDSTILGPVGRQVQVIMLDNRYFKGDHPSGTVLGAAQWQWLSDELHRPANLRVIMSGFQALGSSTMSEGWGEYPTEQQHLLDVIKGADAKGVVIVSGDKHYAEISRRDDAVAYPLYDFTSSSLTANNSYAPEANLYRDTPTSASQNHNFGLITIDWATAGRPVTVQIFDAGTGAVLMSKALSLAGLGSS